MKFFIQIGIALIICFSNSVSAENKTKVIFVPVYFLELSEKTKVPADILYALAVQETNSRMNDRTVRPWPYTINVAGKAFRYENLGQLIAASNDLISEGKRSFDVGLFQVNWRWHSHRVDSIEQLAHPVNNGIVASQILIEQYNIYKNWAVAAGRYHNPNNNHGYADKYQKEFLDKLKRIQNGSYQKSLVDKYELAMK
ncbi:transglycosylase SLT domain-containing protein [Vibrio sp. Evd11]|uniref:transglycosylase SLT domain-containing protein n=1 Tax=Vibrio sp. Evd11 TaxID=1207404 RepID=UPI000EFBB936|nr:transglycosylase SLT domain-containing protein [Vibrio sp. Evd11]